MGTVFFFLTILCFPFMPAGGTVPRWAFLSLVCAALLFRVRFSPVLLGFWTYLFIMAWVAPVGFDATFILWHFLLFTVLFCYQPDMKRVAIGAALGMTVNSGFVVAQYLGWNEIPQLVPNSGLFYNHNMGAEAAAMIFVLAVGYRLWWLLPGILPTMTFGSRAPILGVGLAVGLALWRYSRFAALMATLGAALIVVAVMPGEGGFRGQIISADFLQRVGVWMDILPHLTVWGHGLGSFIVDYPRFQGHTSALMLRFENVHNDFLQIAYELGLGGVILIIILLLRMTAAPRSPAWYALIVFMVEACFGFPAYEPVSGALAACCAAVVFAGCAGLRDLLPHRRSRIWARVEDHELGSFRPGSTVLPAFAHASVRTSLLGHNDHAAGGDTPGSRSFAV